IDRLRTSLQARIGTTRARLDQDRGPEPGALTERELRGDLITAEAAELSRLFDAGTISAATRRRLQRNLDLETARLTQGQQQTQRYQFGNAARRHSRRAVRSANEGHNRVICMRLAARSPPLFVRPNRRSESAGRRTGPHGM